MTSYNPEPITQNYPTYAQCHAEEIDLTKTYLTIKNVNSAKVKAEVARRLPPHAMMPAPDDIVGNYFKTNTIRHAFKTVGGFENSGMTNPQFHELMDIIATDPESNENGILIMDGDTVVMENTASHRATLGMGFGDHITVTETDATVVAEECFFQRGLEDFKQEILQKVRDGKITFSKKPTHKLS